MPVGNAPVHPPVEWAQRKDVIYLKIDVGDCKDPKFDFSDDKLHVRGNGGPDKLPFDVEVEFFKPIDASKARCIPSDRYIQFVIPKQEPGPFWSRLLKSEKKMHWVKVDFDKWKDEDESDEDGMDWDMNDMLGKMGGSGDDNRDLDNWEDSDNEEIPHLEDDKSPEEETPCKEAAVAQEATTRSENGL